MKMITRYIPLAACCLLLGACGTPGDMVESAKSIVDTLNPKKPHSADEERIAAKESLDPASDPLCKSLLRSYTLTESLAGIVATGAACELIDCPANLRLPKNNDEAEKWVREYSRTHLWLPIAMEQAIGDLYLKQQQDKNQVLARIPANAKAYAKADKALAGAVGSYPSNPYTPVIYISTALEEVNAQAKPGGNIFLTKAAVNDLEPDALQLVVAHEVAHLAKRHLSKELQQQLLDTGDAVDLFKKMAKQGNTGADITLASQLLDKLSCKFATYNQEQELQADSCAARVMVDNKADPIPAWKDYVMERGTVATPEQSAAKSNTARKTCMVSSESHPEDSVRERNLIAAKSYHQRTTADR